MNLKTIAREAGVSTATVSNVLNGHFHKVSPATIERVQAIIKAHHYKPSTAARNLASGRLCSAGGRRHRRLRQQP